MPAARRWLVRGRVQGVGFRYFVQKQALKFSLDGWVRNLDDGSVEAFAQGDPDQLNELQGRLWQGSQFSEVRSVEPIEASPESNLNGFRIR